MIRLNFKTTIQILIFFLIPGLSIAQHNERIALTAQVKKDSVTNPFKSPTFAIHIRNTGTSTISIPKKTLLSPFKYTHSFIHTVIEEIPKNEDCTEKIITDSTDVAPIRCNVCFFGKSGKDYLNKSVQIAPGQIFSLEQYIDCYEFNPGSTYRVKFSLDAKKIGIFEQTDWIYFQIPN